MKRAKRLYLWSGVLVVACLLTLAIIKYEEYTEQIKASGDVVISISTEAVETLSWENEDGSYSLYLSEGEWIYEGDDAFPVDEEIVEDMLSIFENMSAAFIIEEVEDYSQYGLSSPVGEISFTTADGSYTIELGSYSQLDEQRYVSIGDGNVYLLHHDPLEEYQAVIEDLIQYDDLLVYDAISEIQLSGAENYTIVYDEESSISYSDSDVYFAVLDSGSVAVDASNITSYLQTIAYLDLTNYVTYDLTDGDLAFYGLDSPELTIAVDCVMVDEDENESIETFVLYVSRHSEDVDIDITDEEAEDVRAYIRVGTSSLIYEISASTYETLLACSYDDFRYQTLFTADFADVTQMEVVIDGVTYTITTDIVDDEFVYYYLDEEIDIAAVQSALTSLQASSFTSDAATGESEIAITLYLDNENYSEIQIELFREDGTYCIATIDGAPVAMVERTFMVNLVEAINTIVL